MNAVDLDARLRAEIEALAAEAGVTASEFMRQAVEGLHKARAHPAPAMEAEPVAGMPGWIWADMDGRNGEDHFGDWVDYDDGGVKYIRADLAHPQDAESLRGEVEPVAEVFHISPGIISDGKRKPGVTVRWINADGLKIGSPLYANEPEETARLIAERNRAEFDLATVTAELDAALARVAAMEAERTKDHDNINLKADFIDATVDQLAAAEAQIAALTGNPAVGLDDAIADIRAAIYTCDPDQAWPAQQALVALEAALTPQPDARLETCEMCCGTGVSGHPDSQYKCSDCNGSGGLLSRPDGEVKVKPLVWETLDGSNCHRWKSPLFGYVRIERYGEGPWHVLWSAPGYCDSFVEGDFADFDTARVAAEARIRAALTEGEAG